MTSTEMPERVLTTRARVSALIARAASMEIVIYANIARAIARRPSVPPGGRGFRYAAPVLTILWIFIILSAVELVIVDLIVHQWIVVRVICLIIGIWGLVWMIGLLFGYYMRPHTVGPDGIEIRNGLDLNIPLSWNDVHSVAIRKQLYEPKTSKIITIEDQRILAVNILSETNIEIELEHPTSVMLPGTPPKGGEHAVSIVRLWAEDPKEFLDEVRNHI